MDIENTPITSPNTTHQPVNFDFFGKTTEFWGIWIVNVLLSIITLGIYSAWAKVRTLQYFYGNTELDGHRFSYLAKPLQILKGRIIAVILLVAYYLLSSLYPLAGLLLMIGLILLMPYLICASLRFNLRMTSYRNVRFNFTGTYGATFVNFILLPIASVFTLYLLLPWVLKRMDQYLMSNIYYGNKPFKAELSASKYYKAAGMVILLTFGAVIVFAILMGVAVAVMGLALPTGGEAGQLPEFSMGLFFILAAYVMAFSFIGAYYQATIRNYILKNTELDDVAKFDSSFTFSSLAFLQLSNLVVIMCTFGLAYPWAKIRATAYTVARTQVMALPSKDTVLDNIGEESSAISEEIANAFDLDIGLS